MYTRLRTYFFLLILVIPFCGLRAQSGIVILDHNPKVCVGTSFSFNMILGTSPSNIVLDGWYDQNNKKLPNQSSVTVVAGITMYILYSKGRYNGETYRDTIKVHGVDRPQIVMKRTDTSACVGQQVMLKCDNVLSATKVIWSTTGQTYTDGSLYTVVSTTTKFKIEATNEACASYPAQKEYSVIPEPLIDPASLFLTTPINAKSCAGCNVDLNSLLTHNADSVSITTAQWKKGGVNIPSSIVTPPASGSETYTAILTGTLFRKNSCGKVQRTFTNFPVTLILTKTNCELLTKWSNNSQKTLVAQPCASYQLMVQNPHTTDIAVTKDKIFFTTASGLPVEFLQELDYGQMILYQFKITPKDFDTIYVSASYTNKCTGSSLTYRDTLYFEPLPVRFEMGSEYCKGDSLEMRLYLNGQAIDNMQIDSVRFGKHQNLFHCYNETPTNYNRLYISNDTMHSRHFFDTIRAYVYYNRCGVSKIDTVKSVVRMRADCYPQIYKQDVTCFGDTGVFVIVEPRYDRGCIKSVVWALPNYTQIIDTLSQIRSDPRGKETRVRIVAYQHKEIGYELVYSQGGVDTIIKSSFLSNYRSCPPNVTQDLRDCRGGQVRARFATTNPTGDIVKNIRTYTVPNLQLPPYDPTLGTGSPTYSLKFLLMRPVKLFYELDYTQGDSTYRLNDSLPIALESTASCAPTVRADAARYCDSEVARLTIAVVNPYDTVVNISWNPIHNSPVTFVSQEEMSGNRFYYYDRVVTKDTTFIAYVKVVNHGDTIIDTIKINILTTQYPHLFKEDTVGVCKEATLNIMQYVNTQFFQGGKYNYFGNIPSITMDPYENERWFKMSGEALSQYMCKSMNGNPTIIDSILIVKNRDPQIVVNPVNSACVGETIILDVHFQPSERVTWIKNDVDTLYKQCTHGNIFTAVVTGSAKYTALVKNACGSISESFMLTATPSPKFDISNDTSICPNALGFFKIKDVFEIETSTLSWSLNDKVVVTGVPNVVLLSNGLAQGQHRVVAFAEGKNGCLARDTAYLTIFGRPEISIDNDLAGYSPHDTSICAAINQPFTLTARGGVSYRWFSPNESTLNPLAISEVKTSTVFRVEGSDANACVDTANFYVTIFPDMIFSGFDSICPNAAYTYCLTPDPQITYQWIKPSLTTIHGPCLNISSMSVADTGWYKLKRTYLSCVDGHDHRLVMKPNPTIKILSHNSPLCEGTDFIATGQANGGAQTWWYLPDGSQQKLDRLTVAAMSHSEAGQYWYGASFKGCSDSVSMQVIVDRHTIPVLTMDRPYYCEGDTLRPVFAPVSSGLQYQFRTSSRSYNSSQISMVIPNLQKSDSGLVYLLVTNGACKDSTSANLEVRTRPQLTVAVKPFFCEGDSMRLLAQSQIPGSILWQGPNGLVSTDKSIFVARLRLRDSGRYQVRITSDGCQSELATAVVNIRPLPMAPLDDNYILCTGDQVSVGVSQAQHTYLWNDGVTTGQRQLNKGGNYWVKITLNACTIFDTTEVDERPKPIFSLPNDTTICLGDALVIQGPLIEDASYLWNTGEQLPELTVDKAGLYTLLIDLNKCTWRDSLRLMNKFCDQFNMPTAFRPGSTIGNDEFRPITKADPSALIYEMSIFDRFGKRVFYTTDIRKGWDGTFKGKELAAGVYVYRIKATELLFMTDLSVHGTITLIR